MKIDLHCHVWPANLISAIFEMIALHFKTKCNDSSLFNKNFLLWLNFWLRTFWSSEVFVRCLLVNILQLFVSFSRVKWIVVFLHRALRWDAFGQHYRTRAILLHFRASKFFTSNCCEKFMRCLRLWWEVSGGWLALLDMKPIRLIQGQWVAAAHCGLFRVWGNFPHRRSSVYQ